MWRNVNLSVASRIYPRSRGRNHPSPLRTLYCAVRQNVIVYPVTVYPQAQIQQSSLFSVPCRPSTFQSFKGNQLIRYSLLIRSTPVPISRSRLFSSFLEPTMAEKKYDLVVFGATGFTGQYTVDEVARVAEEENLTWAVAGRSMAKLQKVLGESSARTGKNLEEIPIIIADSSSAASLEEMAAQAKVVLNCVGPYRFYGEPVVRACILNGAHHLDISGEPQFLEKMQLLYNSKAQEKEVFVIGSTGFDSVPAEAGVMFMEKQFEGGRLTNVESYFTSKSGPKGGAVNTGTFESAVHALANWGEMKDIRNLLYPEPMPKNEFKIQKRVMFFSEQMNKWCVPFIGIDEAILYRTFRDHLATGKMQKPIQFLAYMCMPNLVASVVMMAALAIFGGLAYFAPTRWLLLKFPHIFTFGFFKKGGPTKEQIDGCSFAMTLVGHGFESVEKANAGGKPNRCVIAKLSGPEPGYVTTPICMVQCGVAILKDSASMHHKGGVLTPGAALAGTKLLERLDKHNIKIKAISDTTK